MRQMQSCIESYTRQVRLGELPKAYREILSFLSKLRGSLAKKYPAYTCQALYAGYMDMSYFACTPPFLRERRLKVAIVYVHQLMRFEIWLGGVNRSVHAAFRERLRTIGLGEFSLSETGPGVDSILQAILEDHPDFNRQDLLSHHLLERVSHRIDNLVDLVNACEHTVSYLP